MRTITCALTALLLISVTAAYADVTESLRNDQPKSIQSILQKEKDARKNSEIVRLVNKLDDMYADLYGKLKNGGKLTVYIDPAHGKINGTWRGLLSGRYCVNGLPEEYYSILLLREIYKHLSANKYINIVTPPDHLAAMKGESDSYNDVTFVDSIGRAFSVNAQVIISEHLNNVGSYLKACGQSNIPGIHIVNDYRGRRYLTEISDIYKGFLTLYNRLDVSGFSRHYAYQLRNSLVAKGLTPNNWEQGAVADDRFIYFVDFPISLIYESAFISNPEDLEKITNPETRKVIAKAQADTMIESFRDVFGVDISGDTVKKADKLDGQFNLALLKLSRIALYYLRSGDARSACGVIDGMAKEASDAKTREYIRPYLEIRNRAIRAERLYERACSLANAKVKNKKRRNANVRKAMSLLSSARNLTCSKYYYAGLYMKYMNRHRQIEYHDLAIASEGKTNSTSDNNSSNTVSSQKQIERMVNTFTACGSPVTRPVIMVIEKNQSLDSAIEKALAPDQRTMEKLVHSFSNAYPLRIEKAMRASKRQKKAVKTVSRSRSRFVFGNGIYIVKLAGDLSVESAQRVRRVYLDPGQYQNQQYLKNSSFAYVEKQKSL